VTDVPTYDYQCEACGHDFEHFQSMTSRRLRKCPACGQRKLVRLVGSGAGVIFKGSGFYETDYKRAGAAKKGDGASDTQTEKTEKTEKAEKTDKPAGKNESAKAGTDTKSGKAAAGGGGKDDG
jgi:putative FmdB family regulatory protein